MKSVDLWLVAFGLRCCALLCVEIFTFLYAVPTLFNLHSDLANVAAALLALGAVIGGALWGAALGREWTILLGTKKDD